MAGMILSIPLFSGQEVPGIARKNMARKKMLFTQKQKAVFYIFYFNSDAIFFNFVTIIYMYKAYQPTKRLQTPERIGTP